MYTTQRYDQCNTRLTTIHYWKEHGIWRGDGPLFGEISYQEGLHLEVLPGSRASS